MPPPLCACIQVKGLREPKALAHVKTPSNEEIVRHYRAADLRSKVAAELASNPSEAQTPRREYESFETIMVSCAACHDHISG